MQFDQNKATFYSQAENALNRKYQFQASTILKILDETIHQFNILGFIPTIVSNNGNILRQFLTKTESDYIMLLFEHGYKFARNLVENRKDLLLLYNTIEKINLYKHTTEPPTVGYDLDNHLNFALDLIYNSESLIEFMTKLPKIDIDPMISNFVNKFLKLREVTEEKLKLSDKEEVKQNEAMKKAYTANLLLSNNINEIKKHLETQQLKMNIDYEHKNTILQNINNNISNINKNAQNDIDQLVHDNEILMMKDYIKSKEEQQELSEKANNLQQLFEKTLKDNLLEENLLRAKRLKMEAQLANWINKYDSDIGEKDAELQKLEQMLKVEEDEIDLIQDQLDKQEVDYIFYIKEKNTQEELIRCQKAFLQLQNKAASKIQKYWKAYRARKLSRKKKLKYCTAAA